MFSFSFTMSEQQHRQWTPYKRAAEKVFAACSLSLCLELPRFEGHSE
jgi:hypothetical protein